MRMRIAGLLLMVGLVLPACAKRQAGVLEEPPARCPVYNVEELYHADGSPPPPEVMYRAARDYQGAVADYRARRYGAAGVQFFAVAKMLVNIPQDCGYFTTAETNRLIAYRSALYAYAMNGQLAEGLKLLTEARKHDAALSGEIDKLAAAPPEDCKR
jgi:hypothetical protein